METRKSIHDAELKNTLLKCEPARVGQKGSFTSHYASSKTDRWRNIFNSRKAHHALFSHIVRKFV